MSSTTATEETSDESSDNDDLDYLLDDPLQGIHQQSLLIDSHLDDDLHTGLSSKKIWQRAPGEHYKRFSSDQELWLYINYHIRPYLRILTEFHNRLYIFIAVEIEFEKLTDINDTCKRWSSYRNQNWFSGYLASEFERNAFIEGALEDFSQNCVYEIEGRF